MDISADRKDREKTVRITTFPRKRFGEEAQSGETVTNFTTPPGRPGTAVISLREAGMAAWPSPHIVKRGFAASLSVVRHGKIVTMGRTDTATGVLFNARSTVT